MNAKLAELNADFEVVTGGRFQYFYCPVLYCDEGVPLCQAHIVNRAFPDACRRWTIQRKDVDNFFGSAFESAFVALRLRDRARTPDLLVDKRAAESLHPKLFLDGRPVEHYIPTGPVPPQFSPFTVDGPDGPARLALKMEADATLAAAQGKWEIRIERDLRLPAVVSLLKGPHLTLFDMLGYHYAVSAGGAFLGRTVLGTFFSQHSRARRSELTQHAQRHFAEFAHMVRPVRGGLEDAEGTAADRRLFICMRGTEIRWAFLVIVRTGDAVHSVLVPTFESPVAIDVFLKFVRNQDEHVEARLAKFEGDRWLVSTTTTPLLWPKDNVTISDDAV
jgi:hypothetical protein